MVVVGEGLRKAAMHTAGSNFSHQIAFKKADDHQLVTRGVYRLSRHPSYTGWFVWAVGTQVLLCNPLSIVAYTYASWSFFADRIEFEEEMLFNFFKVGGSVWSQNKNRLFAVPDPPLPSFQSWTMSSTRPRCALEFLLCMALSPHRT